MTEEEIEKIKETRDVTMIEDEQLLEAICDYDEETYIEIYSLDELKEELLKRLSKNNIEEFKNRISKVINKLLIHRCDGDGMYESEEYYWKDDIDDLITNMN